MMLLLSECYRGKIINNEYFLITGLDWSDSICYKKARKLQKKIVPLTSAWVFSKAILP